MRRLIESEPYEIGIRQKPDPKRAELYDTMLAELARARRYVERHRKPPAGSRRSKTRAGRWSIYSDSPSWLLAGLLQRPR
jgi:hypothetical protein